MKFDAFLYDAANLFDLDPGKDNTFRINDLDYHEAVSFVRFLHQRNINCCLLPYFEDEVSSEE